MKPRTIIMPVLALLGLLLAFSPALADVSDFWKTWRDRRATNLQKRDAVNDLMGGKELKDPFLEILESDVWQYRASVTGRIQSSSDEALLAELEKFLFDEKAVAKQPAAAEHVAWGLYNNTNWATEEKWQKSGGLVKNKKTPDKVRLRILRELGLFRGPAANAQAQTLARTNVKVLVDLLAWSLNEKKLNRDIGFLIGDSLESLTSEEFGTDLNRWQFFADNMSPSIPLTPRTAETFKDNFTDVDLEGHTFARKTARPVDLEILILPDLYTSERYWYPYIFEINKTFKCTFVKLPDCSRMRDIEWLTDRTGAVDRSAYYYPLEQLVEVFEERRRQSKQKKVGLIAHGVSAWIALEYLRLYPESVAFAVIIGTWSGEQSREAGRNSTKGEKDDAYTNYAESLLYDPSGRTGQTSLNEEQQFWAQTGSYKRRWGDPKALEPIFYSTRAWQVAPEGSARILVPKWDFDKANKGKKVDVPTLFVHGGKDPMFVKKDEGDYKKTFTKMTWSVFENAGATPWAEQPVQFFEAFEKLLSDHKIIEQLKKEAEKAAADAEKERK